MLIGLIAHCEDRMKIFSYESRFSQIVMRFAYACILSGLWICCSLPIFTIGASSTALYAVTLKIADKEEGQIVKQFFRAFRDNFKQATVIWLIMLGIAVFLGLDVYILLHLRTSTVGPVAVAWTLILAMVIVCIIVWTILLMYLFPLVAKVENTTPNMFKNSFLIGVRYLFCTILVFAIHFAMFVIVVRFFAPLMFFAPGICAWLSSYLLSPVIRACTQPRNDSGTPSLDGNGQENTNEVA